MFRNTAITDGNATDRGKDRMRVTSSTASALSTSKDDGTTFNRVLAGSVHLRDDGEIASKLGLHEAGFYAARGRRTVAAAARI